MIRSRHGVSGLDSRSDKSMLKLSLCRIPVESGMPAGMGPKLHSLSENEDADIMDGVRKFAILRKVSTAPLRWDINFVRAVALNLVLLLISTESKNQGFTVPFFA